MLVYNNQLLLEEACIKNCAELQYLSENQEKTAKQWF